MSQESLLSLPFIFYRPIITNETIVMFQTLWLSRHNPRHNGDV